MCLHYDRKTFHKQLPELSPSVWASPEQCLSDQASCGLQKVDGDQARTAMLLLFFVHPLNHSKAVRKGTYFPNRNQNRMEYGRSKEQMMGFALSAGKRCIKPQIVVKRSQDAFSPEICPML